MKLKIAFFSFWLRYSFFVWQKRVFDEYKSVGSAWNKDSIVTFDLPELDSTKRYDLFINLGIITIINTTISFDCVCWKANGYTKVDTLEYQMAEPDGTLLGNGFTDIKEK
jgi:hypothetical protein